MIAFVILNETNTILLVDCDLYICINGIRPSLASEFVFLLSKILLQMKLKLPKTGQYLNIILKKLEIKF